MIVYLKISNQDDRLSHFDILVDVNGEKTDLICINEFLILKRFASLLNATKKEDTVEFNDFSINCHKNESYAVKRVPLFKSFIKLNLVDENEFSNILNIKNYLNNKRESVSDETLMQRKVGSIQINSIQTVSEKVLIDGFNNLEPIINIDDKKIHPCVRDYLRNCIGLRQISEFVSYCWPVIFRGRHLFGMSNENSFFEDIPLSYVCPLLSLLIEQSEKYTDHSKKFESGYIKNSISHVQNGPILLILCTSCKSALRIYEIIKEILDIVRKIFHADTFLYALRFLS